MLSLSTNGRTLNSKESLGCSRSAATAASLIQQTITTYKESNGEDRSRLVDQNAICTTCPNPNLLSLIYRGDSASKLWRLIPFVTGIIYQGVLYKSTPMSYSTMLPQEQHSSLKSSIVLMPHLPDVRVKIRVNRIFLLLVFVTPGCFPMQNGVLWDWSKLTFHLRSHRPWINTEHH